VIDASTSGRLRLVVIGGGFTGAALIIRAIQSTKQPMDIVVVEPRRDVGRGTAFGTDDPSHRLNVPSDRMDLSKENPAESTAWLFKNGILPDPASDDGTGRYYVPRQNYGSFVAAALRAALLAAQDRIAFRHVRAHATKVERLGKEWRVATSDGAHFDADIVALCFGHAAPAAPCSIARSVELNPKYVPDPWAPRALAKIGPADSVLVVGTGLTMADVVMSLHASGFAGRIMAISRRGLMPREHGLFSIVDLLQGGSWPKTASGLLRLIRQRIRESDEASGWHPIIDSIRANLHTIWRALPAREQRRIAHRLLPFWEVHRFRIAPQIASTLAKCRESGMLSVEKAGLGGLSSRGGHFTATLRLQGGRNEVRTYDAVVLCTGPDKNLMTNPLAATLITDGIARLDDLELGLAVDPKSHVIDKEGRPTPTLFAFGPMTRGSFGEMTGAPDIAMHIENVIGGLFGEGAS
jgi:uncharacterized NAD(P)/FAD-binding protein YdhS